MSKNKKIIISGATGQDGSYMIEYLLKNTENTIIAAIRRTSQAILSNLEGVLDNPRVKLVTMDLNDPHSIENIIKDEKPDYFINFGAQSFVADSWKSPALHMQTNAISLIHILESVRKYVPLCRVYSAGSSEQFGDVKYSPQDEKHPMSPRSVYGVSKCAASQICKVYRESYNLYVVHAVLFNHESPRRQEYFVTRKITKGVARISQAIKNQNWDFKPIELGNIYARRDWSHAYDFMEAVWMMMNQEVYNKEIQEKIYVSSDSYEKYNYGNLVSDIKEYVLSSGQTYAIKEFIEIAFNKAGVKGIWVNTPLEGKPQYLLFQDGALATKRAFPLITINPEFYRPAEVDLLLGDSSLIKKDLGWEPKISFDKLVEVMVESDIQKLKK